jgi:hypothetical protein
MGSIPISATNFMSKKVLPKDRKKRGRPEKIDVVKMGKLEQAFSIDATVAEACSYAEITRSVFYDYIQRHPEFNDRINDLRNKPILKARMTVVRGIDESYANAMDYLKRKRKNEFAERIEQTGADGSAIVVIDQTAAQKYKLNSNATTSSTKTDSSGSPSLPDPSMRKKVWEDNISE